MKLLIKLACVGLAVVAAAPSDAQIVRYGNCAIDFELMNLPDCAISTRENRLYIDKQFADDVFSGRDTGIAAHAVRVGKYRLAWTHLPAAGWAYFDPTGLVVVQNVAMMDNGASDFHLGLVRVTAEDKWGLADLRGKMITSLRYDGILEYQTRRGWLACEGCRTVHQGEYSWFTGGKWVWLGPKGTVVSKAADPTIKKTP
ncbi:MAG TPA: hypothetical protein VG225_04095 [Terracidiphilus sp.]|jgi:hypothetical protein|nr:hypothetical protein [Terracidiphilus sp.]